LGAIFIATKTLKNQDLSLSRELVDDIMELAKHILQTIETKNSKQVVENRLQSSRNVQNNKYFKPEDKKHDMSYLHH
jgi:hypothetical protein